MTLVVLILGSVYQTGKLWFEDISDRSFFYDVLKETTNMETRLVGIENDLILPEQLGVYLNEDGIEYTVVGYGATNFKSMVSTSGKVLSKVLENGTYIGPLEDDSELWDAPHLMLVLPFEYTGQQLASGFSLSKDKAKMIENAATVYVVPADDEQRSLHLYIESSNTKTIHHFQINKELVLIENEVLSTSLANVVEGLNNPSYISTRKNLLPYYDRTILLPKVSRDIRYHSSLFWEIPFVNPRDGSIDEEGIKQKTRSFFDNPDVVGKIAFENEVRFTQGNVSVRYSKEGILDYSKNTEEKGVPGLAEAVGLSEQFMKKRIKNTDFEYYLSDYTIGTEDVTVYYNVGYNGFPIVMSQEVGGHFDMPYSIALTIKGNEVIHYRSILRQIPELMPQFEIFDMPYEDALDSLIAEEGPLTTPITDMYLGYKWDLNASEMRLNWVVEMNDQMYFLEVGGR